MAKAKRGRTKGKRKSTKKQKRSSAPSTSSASNSTCNKCNGSKSTDNNACKGDGLPLSYKITDLGPVIRSPLDTHDYKVVKLESNGLKGLLISTCEHQLDLGSAKDLQDNKASCVFKKITEFNKKYANFDTKTDDQSGKYGDNAKFSSKDFMDASDKQKDMISDRRKKGECRRKAKCRRGVENKDDEMQDARNNLCSVVLTVKAGMFNDPADIQGMAHFCEHAIFLGSEKYPAREHFQKFVESSGGFSNARTEPESTSYSFYIDFRLIQTALDIFIDMIVNPLFDPAGIIKEFEAINSEFEIKRLIDDHRYLALLQSCVVDGHPAGNFGMGTKDTLNKKNILDRLKEWKEMYYTANNMLFTLQGPFPVEQLEKLFGEFCSRIPIGKTNVIQTPLERYIGMPTFNMKKWNKLYHVVPVMETKLMIVSWPVNPKFGSDFKTKPIHYYTYVFNRRDEGSLEWQLRRKGWILSLCLTCPDFGFMNTTFHTVFGITLELTHQGFEQRLDVLRLIFSYINFLKKEKASEMIFGEIQQIHSDIFHYRSNYNLIDPSVGYMFNTDSCIDCLRDLLDVMGSTDSPAQVLVSRFLLTNFNAKLLDEFVESLQPNTALVMFASKSFDGKANEREKWYKTKYYARTMCPGLIKELERMTILKEFNLKKENPYIKVSLCMPEKGCQKIENRSGLKIYKSEKGHVVYGNQDCKLGYLPSALYLIDVFSPVIEDNADQRCVPSMDIFTRMLNYILEIELGPALNSLISYDVFNAPTVLGIELRGPSPKLPELATVILRTLENFDKLVRENAMVFENVRQSQIDETYQSIMCDSENCAENLKNYLLVHRRLFLSDHSHFLENYTINDFLAFVNDFKTQMYVRADLDGCVSKAQATTFANVLDMINYKSYKRKLESLVVDRCLQLPLGERCLLVSAKMKENRTAFVLNHYQVGDLLNEEQDIMLNCISLSMQEMLFEELRTKEQLGYTVDLELDNIYGIFGVSIFVHGQADKHTCGYINEQIDNFMDTFFKRVLSRKETFREYIEPYLNDGEKLSWKATNAFFTDFFLPTGKNMRKVSIQIQGHKVQKSQPACARHVETKKELFKSGNELCTTEGGEISRISHYLDLLLKDVNEENGYYITDVCKFKNSLYCFGNMQTLDVFATDMLND